MLPLQKETLTSLIHEAIDRLKVEFTEEAIEEESDQFNREFFLKANRGFTIKFRIDFTKRFSPTMEEPLCNGLILNHHIDRDLGEEFSNLTEEEKTFLNMSEEQKDRYFAIKLTVPRIKSDYEPSPESWVCRGCQQRIDPNVCWCGTPIEQHNNNDCPTSGIPMGCLCYQK